MMTVEKGRGGPRPWRPGWRTWVEVGVLVAAAFAYSELRRRGEYPQPLIRALRHGTAAEKTEALRALSLAGRAASEAIPALRDVLRSDTDPAIRRGAAFVLAAVAASPEAGEAFPMALLVANSEDPRYNLADADRPPPPPGPRSAEVAVALAEALRRDPDPFVRWQAALALFDGLAAATGLRPPEPIGSGPPKTDPPATGRPVEPWMTAAARAIADRTNRAGEVESPEARLAAIWVACDPAASALLGEAGRFDALAAYALGVFRAGSAEYADGLLVAAAALAAREPAARRDAFLGALAAARTNEPAREARVVAAFWLAAPGASQAASRPEMLDATGRQLMTDSPPWTSGLNSSDPDYPWISRLQQSVYNMTPGGQLANRRVAFPLLDAIRRDAALLDVLAPRLDADAWRALLSAPRFFDDLTPDWLGPSRRSGLSADGAESVAGTILEILDESATGVDRRPRGLAIAAYFARAAGPDSPVRRRLDSARQAGPAGDVGGEGAPAP